MITRISSSLKTSLMWSEKIRENKNNFAGQSFSCTSNSCDQLYRRSSTRASQNPPHPSPLRCSRAYCFTRYTIQLGYEKPSRFEFENGLFIFCLRVGLGVSARYIGNPQTTSQPKTLNPVSSIQ